MISETDYCGPPPEWEPTCEQHGLRLVRGRCPECAAEHFNDMSPNDPGPAQVGSGERKNEDTNT